MYSTPIVMEEMQRMVMNRIVSSETKPISSETDTVSLLVGLLVVIHIHKIGNKSLSLS